MSKIADRILTMTAKSGEGRQSGRRSVFIQQIEQLSSEGKKGIEIADALGITLGAVAALRKQISDRKFRDLNWQRRAEVAQFCQQVVVQEKQVEVIKPPAPVYEIGKCPAPWGGKPPSRFDLMVATYKHLIDLKKQGHSPTRTELNITPDGSISQIHRTRASSSYCSSPQSW